MVVIGFVYVNVNCSDFECLLCFYELFGFCKVIDVLEMNMFEVVVVVGMLFYCV